MPKERRTAAPSYLVINADESEPGTCKDREIMRARSAHADRGRLVAGFAMGAHAAYIYIRGEYIRERERCEAAIERRYDAGPHRQERLRIGLRLRRLRPPRRRRLHLRRRDRAARSLEGKKGKPRLKPPFPAGVGPLRLPDDGQQRRDRSPSRRPSCGAAPAWFAALRPGEQRGHQALLHLAAM